MRFALIVMVATATEACAARIAAPTELESYAASLPTVPTLDDFTEIPNERCSPPLIGLFVTHRALQKAEHTMRRIRFKAGSDVIDARTETKVCRLQLDSVNLQLAEHASDRVWAVIGKTALGVAIAGAVAALVAIVASVVAP